ncbi:hypothetical protein [Pseudomonas sp. 35 E 8]|nr:hypothetical protein [Pseudomonas sp. 35 E 8]
MTLRLILQDLYVVSVPDDTAMALVFSAYG